MNKKLNTWLFIAIGTIFNVIVTILVFLLLLVVFMKFCLPLFPEAGKGTVVQWSIVGCFIGAIVGAFFIYKGVMKVFTKKIDVEKYFDPIFGKRRDRRA
jgi:succinate-acetate transporter protein